MNKAFFLFLLSIVTAFSQPTTRYFTGGVGLGAANNPSNLDPVSIWRNFITTPPTRYASNPITTTEAGFKNTCPAGMEQDPTDVTKFLFYVGEFPIGAGSVGARIRLKQGSHTNYYSLPTDLGIVLQGSESYDINGCRFGSTPFYVGNEIWMYYVGIDASYRWRICRATSTDGRTFTKHGIILDYSDDEYSVSGGAIYREGATWYMYYTAWDGVGVPLANHNPGSSHLGIKYATSTDGISWTKPNAYVIPIGVSGTIDDFNVEDCQIYKFGPVYYFIYNHKRAATEWKCTIAYSYDLTKRVTKTGIIYLEGAGGSVWDADAVSTIYLNPWNPKIAYYQAWKNPPTDIPLGVLTLP